ncbi:MAG: hypothetical protein ACRDYA_12635 [Egibacteraceae bacterium]
MDANCEARLRGGPLGELDSWKARGLTDVELEYLHVDASPPLPRMCCFEY